MSLDEGSDDEYLAALEAFERRQTPAAALAKQQQPCDDQTRQGAPSNQSAVLQQRNGGAAGPALPAACPPLSTGAALGGVRHLFRRPSAAGAGLAVPAISAAAATAASPAPAPTSTAHPCSSPWCRQQDLQPPALQEQQCKDDVDAVMQQQAAPWAARPPFPGTHPQQQQQQQPKPSVLQQAQHRPYPPSALTAHRPLHLQPAQQQRQPAQRQQQQQQHQTSSVPQATATALDRPQPPATDAGQHPSASAVRPPAVAAAAAAAPPPSAAAEPQAAASAPGAQPKRKLKQLFDYLLVYDFEATCDSDKSKQPQPQEIIELSCVAVDTATLRLLPSTFQRYVKPDQHPVLTQFCTQLTGITQDMRVLALLACVDVRSDRVDGGIPLREALSQHEAWLREQEILGKGRSFVPVTWRDWDLKVQLAMETKWRGIEQPGYLKRWVDISAVWFKHSKARGNLRSSVEAAGLQWEGRAHSAIDDARNTARLAVKLMQSGVILGITGSFSGVDASGRFKQATLQLRGGTGSGSKCSGGITAGSGPTSRAASSRPSGGLGFGMQQQRQPAKKKKKIYDAAGAWNGCCFCGVHAKKRQVKRPGPNHGRDFWSCGNFSMTGGGPACDFFKFTSELVRPPAAAKKQR